MRASIAEAEIETDAICSALEYAPKVRSTNPGLSGMWTKAGCYVCADCSARLVGRGFGFFLAVPVYVGDVRGACCGCEPLRDHNGDLRQ